MSNEQNDPKPPSNRQYQADIVATRAELQNLIDRNAALLETVTGRRTILYDITAEELATNAETREWILEHAKKLADHAVESFQRQIDALTQQRDNLTAVIERN